jgi:DNA-binding NarL/FixJ family response regulator
MGQEFIVSFDSRISVALVEDDAGMRARIAKVVGENSSLELIFAAENAQEMLEWLLKKNTPNVLLVDLGLPDRSGSDVIAAAQKLSPNTEVMVLTLFGDEANMIKAFEAGARGYLLKDGTEDDLALHIMNLHAGGSPMSPIIARQLLVRLKRPSEPSEPSKPAKVIVDALSPREAEILQLLARGYTYAELAEMLGIKFTTIHTHVRNIYSKLAVHSKTEAVFEARQLGLLDP